MKKFTTLTFLFILGCSAADKGALPDNLKSAYLQSVNRQLSLNLQYQQTQAILPKIKEEYDKLTPVVKTQEDELKKVCTSAGKDFQAFPEVKCVDKVKK